MQSAQATVLRRRLPLAPPTSEEGAIHARAKETDQQNNKGQENETSMDAAALLRLAVMKVRSLFALSLNHGE